ncbi:cytochrome c3 family protein [Telmatospirillum sp.]|uniref:cytochrome c3 family protein n=1 Tax=Telmatospirillum sp. TaxID=2079197 RepID=UPI002842F1F3|nr:cytochrome c3 family protein [Telmatospirillum sp.]MDR3440613.1 cytochrome c3 family protein [Telmatospirillum sp.]
MLFTREHPRSTASSATMLSIILTLLVCLFYAVSPAGAEESAANGTNFLADRHENLSQPVDCAGCHGEKKPKTKASDAGCLNCHGPYSKMAAKTAKLEINPHDSHLGEIDCTFCHAGHKPPKNKCAECHDSFTLKTP